MKHRIPFAERILCSPAEAGEALDKGKTQIFAMIGSGRLRTVKHGARRHVYVASVLEVAGVRHSSPGTANIGGTGVWVENWSEEDNYIRSKG